MIIFCDKIFTAIIFECEVGWRRRSLLKCLIVVYTRPNAGCDYFVVYFIDIVTQFLVLKNTRFEIRQTSHSGNQPCSDCSSTSGRSGRWPSKSWQVYFNASNY